LSAFAKGLPLRTGQTCKIRDFLENTGFFDADERKKLVDGVYAYLSGEGSTPEFQSKALPVSALAYCGTSESSSPDCTWPSGLKLMSSPNCSAMQLTL
jgi:hypothetical protein